MSQKNCAKLFLSELRQISTNFDNFWQKGGKEAKIMRDALIFHLTYFTYLWKFDEFLAKTILHSFFRHGVDTFSIGFSRILDLTSFIVLLL